MDKLFSKLRNCLTINLDSRLVSLLRLLEIQIQVQMFKFLSLLKQSTKVIVSWKPESGLTVGKIWILYIEVNTLFQNCFLKDERMLVDCNVCVNLGVSMYFTLTPPTSDCLVGHVVLLQPFYYSGTEEPNFFLCWTLHLFQLLVIGWLTSHNTIFST